MDSKILEKARKLQSLVERGEMGEAKAAKRALDALCMFHGIDIDTLFDEKREWREFIVPYQDTQLRRLLFQCIHKVLNVETTEYTHNKYRTRLRFNLTDAEFAEVNEMFNFYKRQWKKELKRLKDDLFIAFLNKNDIFSKDCKTSNRKEMTPEEWQRILRATQMMSQLEDAPYLKGIE